MDKKELDKYYSMEERQKRLNLQVAPDSDTNRKKRAAVLAKESANYGNLQKQFEKENFGKGGGEKRPVDAKAKPVREAAQRLLEKERKPIAAKAKPVGPEKYVSSSRGGGGGGGGGISPVDIEKVPGKRPLKMKKGGSVKSSASKRADGVAMKGKTKGRMV